MLKAKLKLKVDVAGVMNAVRKKSRRVLYSTGAFGRQVMKRSIRAPKSGRKSRTVVVEGQALIVPVFGKVLDAKSRQPVRKELADAARRAMAARLRSEGAGKPPRRGPSDLLRQGLHFSVDEASETVTIGAMMFANQARLVGAASVPDLLNKGGGEIIAGQLVKYEPRPFVEPALETTYRKMADLVEKVPL
jgi:hypothetical protein